MPGNIRLWGTSGYVELAAPSTAANQVLTLPTDSIQPAMVLITNQSFSATSQVSVDNCFTSEYDNYRILIRAFANTGTPNLMLRYRSSGADRTGAIYSYSQNYGTAANTSTAQTAVLYGTLSVQASPMCIDVFQPTTTALTTGVGLVYRGGTSPITIMSGHWVNETVSHDGFSVYPDSGATLSGKLFVYGYKK